MADAQLQILIKARNEAKATFDSVNKQVGQMQGKTGFGGLNDKLGAADAKFKSLTGMSLGFASAAGLAGAAVSGLAKFLTESVNEMVDYATKVDNMARLLGITTEETSRLIQASDDLFISQEILKSGLEAATRQGIDVSIEGLKNLSEQYLSIEDKGERSTFVLKAFGRSGAEMAKLMEQGADGIDAATAAIAENMIVTEQSMKDIMNYKRSIDNLSDSWQGFKYTVGSEVIPQLDLLMRVMTKGKDEVEAHAQAINRLQMQYNRAASAAAIGNDSAAAAMVTLQAEMDALNEEFYGTEEAAGAVTDEITGLGTSLTMVTQYFGALTEQMLFNRLAANMTEEAALALSVQMGLLDPMTYSLTKQMDALTTKYDTNADGVISAKEATAEYVEEVRALQQEINALQSKTIDIVINWKGEGGGGVGGAENLAGIDLNGNGIIGAAKGADFTVPPGFNNDSLIMGVSSGEHVKVTPAPNKGSGNTIVFNYSPALSLSDRAEVESKIKPMLRQLIRDM